MRVHMWAADTAGSGFYRAFLPGMALTWLDHKVTVDQRLPRDWNSLDTIVGCRIAVPYAHKMWRRFKKAGIRLILDLDDDYFHLDPVNARAVREWDTGMRRRLAENMALADVVTCCSEPLAAVLREYADDVRVIPNGLPAQYLGAPRDYAAVGRPLNVGWAGSSSTLAELPLAARALNRIADYARPDGVQVRLIGITPEQAMAAGVRGKRAGALGWVPDPQQYLPAASEFDVWVAPYRDIAFNRAKFATKFLESSVLGIPLIASDIEPYRRVIRHGENGFLVPVGREHLFGRYLKALVDDGGLRQQMGMAARGEASGSILQAINRQWQAVLTAPMEVAA